MNEAAQQRLLNIISEEALNTMERHTGLGRLQILKDILANPAGKATKMYADLVASGFAYAFKYANEAA